MCNLCNLIDDFAKKRIISSEMLEYSFTDKKKIIWKSCDVDSQFDDRIVTSDERENSLDNMIILALESCLK